MDKSNIELIEEYIEGNLKGSDLTMFEERLKIDPELKNEYEVRLKIAELWTEAEDYKNTKEQIAGMLKPEQGKFFISKQFYYLSVAASIIFMVGLYFMFFFHGGLYKTQMNQMADNDGIVFKKDTLTKLAKIDSVNYYHELLSPVLGEIFTIESIIDLSWRITSSLNDTLYVVNEFSNVVVLKRQVNSTDTSLLIKSSKLGEGTFIWYINDAKNKGNFIIQKNKK